MREMPSWATRTVAGDLMADPGGLAHSDLQWRRLFCHRDGTGASGGADIVDAYRAAQK
jgi:hypothetical protein